MNDWPHAPPHRTFVPGLYMITAGTYQKALYFQNHECLKFLHDHLLKFANEYGWTLQSWAVFANHYHFIARSPQDPKNLSSFLAHLHIATASYANTRDNSPNRRIWWQYWDSRITFQNSYLARLNYVNQNPVKHGLVSVANDYPWCSASWFEKTTPSSFYKTVRNFKTDQVKVMDDF